MPDKTAKPDIFGKKLYSFQLFEETSNFVWPEIGSVVRSQSISFLLYTLIFQKFSYLLSTHIYLSIPLFVKSENLDDA